MSAKEIKNALKKCKEHWKEGEYQQVLSEAQIARVRIVLFYYVIFYNFH